MNKTNLSEMLEVQQKYSYRAYMFKLSLVVFLIVGGFIFTILGITGSVEIAIEATTVKGKIINASPGMIFVFCGTLIALNTHYIVLQDIDEKHNGLWNTSSNYTQGGFFSKNTKNVISQSKLATSEV